MIDESKSLELTLNGLVLIVKPSQVDMRAQDDVNVATGVTSSALATNSEKPTSYSHCDSRFLHTIAITPTSSLNI